MRWSWERVDNVRISVRILGFGELGNWVLMRDLWVDLDGELACFDLNEQKRTLALIK